METYLRNLIKLLCLSWIFADVALAQNFQPLIPMSYSSRDIPLVELTLRDPEILKRSISDDLYYEQAVEEMKAAQSELQVMQGPRRQELLENLYRGFVNMSYFLEDVRAGRIHVQANYHPIEPKLADTRKMAMTYATQFANITKNTSKKATALYHAQTSRYLLEGNSRGAVRSLKSLEKQLNGYLKRRVQFLAGLDDISYGNRARGKNTLRQVVGGLPKSGGVAARLAIARNDAGLNRLGRKVRQSEASYRSWLVQAARRGQSFSRLDREKILSFTVAVWRGAEGQKASWNKPPFNQKAYADIDLTRAMAERSALGALRSRQYDKAIRQYSVLSDQYKGLPIMGHIDHRILSIHKLVAERTKQPSRFQNALLSYQQKYRDQNRNFNQQVAQDMSQKIDQEHKALVRQVLQRGQAARQSKAYRHQAIQIAERYLATHGQGSDYVSLKSQIARIHVLSGNHQTAVAIYLDLKNRTRDAESFQYLNLAISSQSVLAAWPSKAPWAGVKAGNRAMRGQLASLYTEKYQKTSSWDDLAHLGLLWIQLGQAPQAYKTWTEKLQQQATGVHARRAAGHMLMAYQGARQWQAMEDLARLAIASRLAPLAGNRSLNPVVFLGDALFFGGKELFDQQKWAESVKKLDEFVKTFRNDQRRPEGLFFLAQGHHNNASHPLAVETMMYLVNEYPNSRFMREALYLGGNWSVPMAYEEQTIFFFQTFVERFTSDQRTPALREHLIDLYMGRDLYGHAARTHQAIATDRRSSREQQIRSALAVMDIEERYGETKYAQWGANKAREIAGNKPDVIARILAFETRNAVRQRNFAQVERFEKQLSGMPSSYREVAEALAQVRFIIAESRADITKQEFFNIGLKDPSATLEKQFAIFRTIQNFYEGVCEAGMSSYCAPAMMRLSETTKNTLNTIDEISIAQTLDEKIVQKFEKRKLGIVVYLSELANKCDERALGMTEEGRNTPDWSREIMWVNSTDWNFEEGNPTSGNGYVQWAPVMMSDER